LLCSQKPTNGMLHSAGWIQSKPQCICVRSTLTLPYTSRSPEVIVLTFC
jgi:hypothetical protein